MRILRSILIVVVVTAAGACGDDGSGGGGDDGGTRPGRDGGTTGRDSGPSGGPPEADCAAVPRVDVSAGVDVATEDELRAAVAAGGNVRITADITATAPFEITTPTVVDGGGFTVSGGGTTHLFVSRRTDFTIQNATLVDGNNQVDDGEHFSRRSGAAVMANGGSNTEGPGVGSLTVIDVTFERNQIKPTGPGDLRGGALYGFRMPDITISGAVFRDNVGSNGGAIGGLGSSFRIVGTSFLGNRTSGPGPGGALEGVGGAISLDALSQNETTAYLEICGCEFRDNVASNGAGGIYLVTHWYTDSTVAIDQTVFAGNRTTSTDEGQGGAIFLMDDEKPERARGPNAASITSSLFSANEVYSRGAGVWYWTMDGRLTVQNVTFVNNRVFTDDTGMGGGVAISRGPADFVNCTFAHNWAKFHGAGIQMGGDAVVSMLNTLFYQNLSNRDGGWANFHTNREVDTDLGGNMQFLSADMVIDSNSDALVSADAMRADPQLADLADNGGPTWTMALPAGSPAVDAGDPGGAPATDQRGMARDGSPDIGAFELQ